MEKVQLKPGDVLLLDPEWMVDKKTNKERQDCISLLICRLDSSPVSHAALCYSCDEAQNQCRMAEEILEGLVLSPVPHPGESKRTVYIRRYEGKDLNTKKLIATVARYLDNPKQSPYALGSLVTAGLLLLTKHFIHNPLYIKLAEKALHCLCKLLLALYPGKTPMTCAQFVTNCYQEAGVALFPEVRKSPETGNSLAALAAKALKKTDATTLSWKGIPQAEDGIDPKKLEDAFEELCCKILHWLNGPAGAQKEGCACMDAPGQAEARVEAENDTLVTPSFLNTVTYFTHLVLHGIPAQADAATPSSAALAAKDLEILSNAFVSPGDLFKCAKLTEIGTISPEKE